MGIKRSKPLMIDSHTTLTNLNDPLDSAILTLDRNNAIKIDDDSNEPKAKFMRFDNENSNTGSGSTSRKNSFASKGVVINDVTDNLIKSAININLKLEDEVQNIKVPFVDLIADSPSSNQVGWRISPAGIASDFNASYMLKNDEDADADDFLNSSLFLNTDIQDDGQTSSMAPYVDDNTTNSTTSSSNHQLQPHEPKQRDKSNASERYALC